MKTLLNTFTILLVALLISPQVSAQKKVVGAATITSADLNSHLSFLASPLLKGRKNGGEGLDIAARYLASQASKTGLKPANGDSYYQYYTVVRKSMDPAKTVVEVSHKGGEPKIINEKLFQLIPMGASDFQLEGDVVFAGYGIKADKYNYNDIDTLKLAGKIVLIMDRAPTEPDGKTCRFGDNNWLTMNGLQLKLQSLMFTRPKAVLIVADPKSGFSSFGDAHNEYADYLSTSLTLKGQKGMVFDFPGMPKIIFVHRSVADELLKSSGHSLEELQNAIDSDLKCHSFAIDGSFIRITEASVSDEIQLPNIAGYIEGSDPALKNEYVIYSAHMDHTGGEGDKINAGADDDATGCSALLELAEAFASLPKKPARSILFLWVSGEEVGLFGSQSYVDNPLVPLEKTIADLNIDMIGRVKGVADTSKQNPMTGPSAVFVISGNQSKELINIADAASKKTSLELDYSLSGRTHPLSLFSRSDHFNFVKKDIPVIFFTTGLHTDYHTPGDVIEKIDFNKMQLIVRTMYDIGFNVANQKTRIVVDNPYSTWNKSAPAPEK